MITGKFVKTLFGCTVYVSSIWATQYRIKEASEFMDEMKGWCCAKVR